MAFPMSCHIKFVNAPLESGALYGRSQQSGSLKADSEGSGTENDKVEEIPLHASTRHLVLSDYPDPTMAYLLQARS